MNIKSSPQHPNHSPTHQTQYEHRESVVKIMVHFDILVCFGPLLSPSPGMSETSPAFWERDSQLVGQSVLPLFRRQSVINQTNNQSDMSEFLGGMSQGAMRVTA